jgi:hypothetical protein
MSDAPKTSCTSLRVQKETAIREHNFELAVVLEQQIRGIHESEASNSCRQREATLLQAITGAADKFHEESRDTRADLATKTLVIRVDADAAFDKVQSRHIDQLTELEQAFALAVIRESDRPVQYQSLYFFQAMTVARHNDFKRSVWLREEAEAAAERQFAGRRELVNSKFAKLRATLLDRHAAELKILTQNLVSELTVVEKEWRKVDDRIQRSFLVEVRAALRVACRGPPDTRMQEASRLTSLAHARVLELTGIELVPGSPARMPAKTPRKTSEEAQAE